MVDAREYHERTNHTPQKLHRESFRLDRSIQPRPYKIYEDLPSIEAGDPDPPDTPALDAVATATADPPDSASAADADVGPDADADAGPDADADAESDADPHIPTLCHYAAGVTKELAMQGRQLRFRAAACTGKLYHVDMYAVTGDCGAFDPGVYHFDPHSGSFDVLRNGDYRGVLADATGEYGAVAEAPVTFVATSEWWRNAWKYRERTYRHAFWDSGTILANLLAVAHGSGHRAEVVTGFADDPVVSLLGVDPDAEAPLALVPVGSDASNPAPADAEVAPIDPEEAPLSDEVVEYPLVPDAWRQSRLADGDAAREWRDRFGSEALDAVALSGRGTGGDGAVGTDAGTDSGPGREGDRVALDPVDSDTASARPVGATIDRRGSLREYSHDPVSARKFATVLDRALGGTPCACLEGGDLSGLVDYYCLVHAVEGVDQGVYEYHPGSDELEWVRDTDRDTAGHLALDQGVVGDAAVNVYAVADVDAVVERFGDRGYRLAQLDGGIALGRLYLATYAHLGLGGRGFTFYDEPVREYLSPHAAGQQPMTLFAFGKPA